MDIWDKQLINLQEQVYILFLNNELKVISWRHLNTGTSSQTLFDIKLAMACALGCMASKIIIAHNQPSGTLIPSVSDKIITEKLKYAANLMGIKLEDHIIINSKSYFSFADNRLVIV